MTIEEHTRRRFLAGLGVGGAAAALATGDALAAPAPPGDGGVLGEPIPGTGREEGAPARRAEVFPAQTPGTRYHLFNGGQFAPLSDSFAYSKIPWLIAPTSGPYAVPLNMLPNGAVISELSFAIIKSSSYTGDVTGSLYRLIPYDAAPPSGVAASANSSSLPQMSVAQIFNVPMTGPAIDRTIDRSAADHWLIAQITNNVLLDVRVGWLPPAAPLGFYPLAPKRVYDSRRPTGGGPLAAGGTRVVSVKDGFINDTDTLDAPNVVPVGAKAIAYNLTIVGTTGAGYLSVGPGDAAAAAGSAINWGGPDQVLANGLTVTVDASRQIKVFAGPGGGTHFLIDVMGYYA